MNDFRLANCRRPAYRGLGGGLAAISTALLLIACAPGQVARDQGLSLLTEAKFEEGLALLAESVRQNPGSAQMRSDYLFQRGMIADRLLSDAAAQRRANRLDAAEVLYRRVLGFDSNNAASRQGLNELDTQRRHERVLDEAEGLIRKSDLAGARSLLAVVLVENPANPRAIKIRNQIEEPNLRENLAGASLNIKGRKPLTLQFRDANLKMVLEAIARTTGVNIMLDKDVRNDIKVTIFVRDTPVEETLDLLLIQNQLEKRILGDNTVLIYPATSAKEKEYQDLKIRRFALGNADPKQVQNMLKTILKVKDIFVDEKTSAIVIRDKPDVVRLAERLVAAMDQAIPEVMLEIDVMQVDRKRMLSLGIDWTQSFTWSLRDKMTLQDFRNATSADVNVSGFSVTANASKTDGDVNDLATPRIRVRNKEKAKILVGTRNPVVSSAATPAVAGGGATVYNTSVTYIETGIKVEVEPDIHPDGEVAIKLNLEVSSAGAQINTGPSGTVAFPVNTNNVTTLLQLKDGETQILGGLLQTQADQSQSKIPGVGDVPVLGRLFGSTKDTWNKTELLLAITPHIIRNVSSDQADLMEMWSGTEAQVRYGAPNVKVAGGAGVVGQINASGPSTVAPLASAPSPRPAVAPAVTLMPSLQGPSQANVGDKLNIIFGLVGGPALSNVNAVIRYDAAVVRAFNVAEGDVLKKSAAQGRFDRNIDEGAGTVTLNLIAAEGGMAPGGGNLAVISFEVLAGGNANVSVKSMTATGLGGSPVPAASATPLQIVVP